MPILLIKAIGLNEDEATELKSVIQKWNLRRKHQEKNRIQYLIQNNKKKLYSRGMYERLHRRERNIGAAVERSE